MATHLGINIIATKHEYPNTIRRVARKPPVPVKYPYLVVSDQIEDMQHADIVVVRNFDRIREKLKKKIRTGVGLEILIAPARLMDSEAIAKWLVQVQDLYRFCKLTRCQLIISSGATSPLTMISGRGLDALLEEFCISPTKYWAELEKWLESRLARRVNI